MLRVFPLLVLVTIACVRPPPEPVTAPDSPGPSAKALEWYLRGRLAEEYGEFQEAERAYRWSRRLDPSSLTGLTLAVFLTEQGRPNEALTLLSAPDSPDHPEWRALEGRLLLDSAERARGIEALWLAVELGDRGSATERLSTVLDPDADADALRRLLTVWSDTPQLARGSYHLARARLAEHLGAVDTAIDDLVRAHDREDVPLGASVALLELAERTCRLGTLSEWAGGMRFDDPHLRTLQMRIARATGDARTLDVLLEDATEPEAIRRHIQLLLEHGRLDDALDRARAARARQPNDMALRYDLGRVLSARRQVAPALVALEAIPASSPYFASALRERMRLLSSVGREREVLELARGPSADPEVRWVQAQALAMNGQLAEADARVESDDSTSDGARLRRLGLLADLAGRTQLALERLGASASPRARRDRLSIAVREGDARLVDQLLQELLAHDPLDLDATRRWAERTGDREPLRRLAHSACSASASLSLAVGSERLEWLERAWQAAPYDPDVLEPYGAELLRTDDSQRGLELLQRALRLDPSRAPRILEIYREHAPPGAAARLERTLDPSR